MRLLSNYKALVCPDGYEWVNDELHPCTPYGRFSIHQLWQTPLRNNSTLFVDFANTPTKRDAILGFANENGELTDDREPESFRSWAKQIAGMKKVLEVWQAYQSDDLKFLRKKITGDQKGHLRFDGTLVVRHPWVKLRDTRSVTMAYLETQIWSLGRRNITYSVSHDPKQPGWQFQLHGTGLLEALWLQFALAVANDIPIQRCKTCGLAIDISDSDSGARSDKSYCDDACRSRAYRERKKKARQMKEAGTKPAEIAKSLGTTVKRIKNWLK